MSLARVIRGRLRTRAAALLFAAVAASAASGAASLAPAVAAPAARWMPQRSTTTADLNAVSFSDARHGHAVGAGGTILDTANGGKNWVRQLACASSSPCLASSPDRITRSLLAVDFVDAFHGWITGAGGTILATSDGGTTWTPQLACAETSIAVVRQYCNALSADRVTVDLHGLSFVDPLHGWTVGDKETILATADGGRTWVQQIACLWGPVGSGYLQPCPARPTSNPPEDLRSVSFVDPMHGMAVGLGGYAIDSGDGGQSWGRITSSGGLELTSVTMVVRGYPDTVPDQTEHGLSNDRQDTAHAVGIGGSLIVSGAKGLVWYGSPGMDSFASQPPPTEEDLNGVAFCDRVNGIAVGEDGTIERTTDEGISWFVDPSGTHASLRGVALPDANDAFVVGEGGVILTLHTAPIGLEVTGVTPHRVAPDGGLPITITGKGFTGAEEVSFGKAWAYGFSVDSDHQITAMPPQEATGTVHVTVTVNGMTSVESDADTVTFTAPSGGTWTTVGSCPDRCDAPAVRLHGGRVLIEGGHPAPIFIEHYADVALATAELFDPSTGRWTTTAPMHVPRVEHTATLLADGRVLVAGGFSKPGSGIVGEESSAEIYDPSTGRWTMTGSMHRARRYFASVLLPNGDVLVAGGDDPNGETAELWNPSTGRWTMTGSMHDGRADLTLLLLHTGKVLVVGSLGGDDTTTELYDPSTGRWSETGALEVPRQEFTATLLDDGSVLVAGGRYAPPYVGRAPVPYPFAELYNPTTGTWQPTGPMVYARVDAGAAVMGDGRVLVMGGSYDTFRYCPPCREMSSAEIYDPATGAWSVVASMAEARDYPIAVPLADGGVLVTGYDGVSEVFHAAPTAAEAAATGGGWMVPLIAAVLGVLIAGAVAVVAMRRRANAPPLPHGSRDPLRRLG